MSQQQEFYNAYENASPEEKCTGKFFKELPIENMIDHEAIAYAKQAGLVDPIFKTGKMSCKLV